MIDCLWYKKKNPLGHFLKKLTFRIVNKTVDRYTVWASHEIDAYSKVFGLPKKKFTFVPYHTTTLDIKPTVGDYIFSGGNFDRDYETLIRAVEGLPIKLYIGCTRPEAFSKISIPGNVDVRGYSHGDYMQKMAGCKINVVSMAPGLLHSGGQQTFLNSMWYGKPTIVNDPEGAVDYIKHGEDGMLVNPADPSALRKAILWCLDHPREAKEMGANAMRKARTYSTEEHFKKIVSIVKEVVENKKR
jgi:glycosyltransferase involved in cell wall biosynthesis